VSTFASPQTDPQGNFTHIALLLDASSSMDHLEDAVVRVVDGLVEDWQHRSVALDDMTRLTVYQFSSDGYMPGGGYIECIHYDTDITRIKSLKGRYKPRGATALIDSTIFAQQELALTPTKYGSHSFLFYAISDGQNNRNAHRAGELRRLLGGLEPNWTVAALVPNIHGRVAAEGFGFPSGNIMVWDATSEAGIEEAGRKVAQATASYMQTRSSDASFRGTRSLFVGGQVDANAVKQNLVALPHVSYDLVTVTKSSLAFEKFTKPSKTYPQGRSKGWFVRIDDFMNKVAPPFEIGKGYYQLFSAGARTREKVQGNKQIAVMDKKTSQIYVGPQARGIVGLPDHDENVAPGSNPDYEIFVKSTSDNRHLPVGTKLLIMK